MSIRILLADDQALLRTGFRMILQAQPDLDVVGEAVDGADAVRQTARLAPDVVLMDVRMPGMDGIAATAEITARSAARVLVLTTFDLDEYAFAALRAGASGFLLKDVPPDVLAGGIRSVAAGDAVISAVATMPSVPGMRTSMRTTSGRSRPVWRTASAPSTASPTTSRSGCACRIMRKPMRSSSWSSASRMRMLIGAPSERAAPRGRSSRRTSPVPSTAGRRREPAVPASR